MRRPSARQHQPHEDARRNHRWIWQLIHSIHPNFPRTRADHFRRAHCHCDRANRPGLKSHHGRHLSQPGPSRRPNLNPALQKDALHEKGLPDVTTLNGAHQNVTPPGNRHQNRNVTKQET